MGESHLNLINTLNCPLVARMNISGVETMVKVNGSSNYIFYDLKSDQEFNLMVQIMDKQCLHTDVEEGHNYSFTTIDEHVSNL